jgi:hypothetical protein
MATITTATYLDGGTARTAGEVWTINSGAVLTIRTDTRTHSNAPASMTGTIGNISINDGEVIIDARNIRWLAYTGGTGNVPAIGTTVTKGGVSGYLLGVWAGLTTAPTAVGSAMPATGFIKFREVTGGTFSAGALTGIGATASGADVTGWMEVVHDQTATIAAARLGKYTTRGDYFYLDNTTGIRGQVLQTPTNGGGTNTHCSGVEVETAPGSGVYEKYTMLASAANGWLETHIGQAKDEADKRQMFVKGLGNGQMRFGERITKTGTYAYTASQTTTYASNTRAGYYFRENNVVTVFCSGGHFLLQGMSTGFDATSGTATDGIVTPTVLDAYYFSFPQVGADTEGTCNSREGVTCTFTNHGLNIGEKVYLTPTTGTLPAGEYEIYGVNATGTYLIKYPHTAVLTSGSTECLHTITLTFSAAHGLSQGNRIHCDFTTGTGVDGVYTVKFVPNVTTVTINCPLSATTSGNFTTTHDLGYVPPAGCKTRIPNIFGRECTPATRSVNNPPNLALATRPEFQTSSAGAIDIEYLYGTNWYLNFSQPYAVSIKNSWTMDTINLAECATPFTLSNVGTGMYGAFDNRVLQCSSNFAGGLIENCDFMRGNPPGATDHSVEITYCKGIEVRDSKFAIVQYLRNSGNPLQIANSSNITLSGVRCINNNLYLATVSDSTITNYDYTDRMCGWTNTISPTNAINIDIRSSNVVVDGITIGFGGTILNNQPATSLVRATGGLGITFRNIGTPENPIKCGSWMPNVTGLTSVFQTGGNGERYRLQRAYVETLRGDTVVGVNTDKGVEVDNVHKVNQYSLGAYAVAATIVQFLNSDMRGIGNINSTTGSASVYGVHWSNNFGVGRGRLVLHMNEPSTETANIFTSVSGITKFNSSGGALLESVGTSSIWETFLFKGITKFNDYEELNMSVGAIGSYLLEYQLDTGSGYGDWHNLARTKTVASGASGANTIVIADTTGLEVGDYIFGGTNLAYRAKVTAINGTTITLSKPNRGAASGTIRVCQLPSEVANPAGTKMKMRITTTIADTTAITYVRLNTITSWADQTENTYPLDTITATMTGMISGSDIVILPHGTETVRATAEDISGTTYAYTYETPESVDIRVYKEGYFPFSIENYMLGSTNASVLITQVPDTSYIQ